MQYNLFNGEEVANLLNMIKEVEEQQDLIITDFFWLVETLGRAISEQAVIELMFADYSIVKGTIEKAEIEFDVEDINNVRLFIELKRTSDEQISKGEYCLDSTLVEENMTTAASRNGRKFYARNNRGEDVFRLVVFQLGSQS